MSGAAWRAFPNCDVTDLTPGDLIAWEGRAMRVVAIYPVEPVDWRADEVPGRNINPLSGTPVDERPPCRVHLDDGSRKGLHLRIGFRPTWTKTVERLKPHHATCGHCGHLWPCPDERIDREVQRAAQAMERLCQHCGKDGGGMTMFGGPNLDIPGQMGAWFHSRTKRRAKCADAADDYERRRRAQRDVLTAAQEAVEGGAS